MAKIFFPSSHHGGGLPTRRYVLLRLTNTVQPDNTSVINEYYPSGALWKVLGARTCLRG